ncbi:hypothetical protein KGQ20_13190 [Catenulispora sp. NF23]|uniref:hypothetical protein n=1 Tax=Catenulispora pinistramenti TaxID=2705254 RepID=UPI001BA76DDE|nr:hypothetical protein [Catenulispora pinistramenti]MBS2533727.1 hypothetical protein [Catenulispora pinistramenti]
MDQPLRAMTDRVYVEFHKFDLEEGEEYLPGETYLFQFWPARPIPDDRAAPYRPKRSPRVPHGMQQG